MIEKNKNVRLMTEYDIDKVMHLAKRHLLEINMSLNNASLSHCVSLVERAASPDVTQPNGVIIGVLDGYDGPCSYIVLEHQVMNITGQSVLDVSIYVDPEYRSGPNRYAYQLIEFAKEQSIISSLPLYVSIMTNRSRRSTYLRFLRRWLGDPISITYSYDPSSFANT